MFKSIIEGLIKGIVRGTIESLVAIGIFLILLMGIGFVHEKSRIL